MTKQSESRIKIELHPKQEFALNSEATEILFGGSAGGGKAAWINELVCTPFGFRRILDIEPGDIISSPNGVNTRVIAVSEVHKRRAYKVTFNDDTSTIVADSHLWRCWSARKKSKQERGATGAPMKGFVCTTEQLKERVENGYYKIKIPINQPVQFSKPNRVNPRSIDPYSLGVLLGDGCITSKQITLASADLFIIEKLRSGGMGVTKIPSHKYGWILRDSGHWHKKLEKLGIHRCNAKTKFIPKCYKYAPIEDRLNLVRGLMDTDGYMDQRGHVQYTTISEELSQDMAWILRSLGCYVKITTKMGGYRDINGEKIQCKKVYMLYVQSRDNSLLFSLPRKKNRGIGKKYNGGVSDIGKTVVLVEPIGEREVKCIQVESPDGLYIQSEGFIVTHNSHLMRMLAIIYASAIPGIQIYLFRRHLPDLIKNHMEGPSGFRALLSGWVSHGLCQIVEDEIRFPKFGNSKIFLCHCQDEVDRYKYQGAEIHLLLMDELTTFSEVIYTFLRSRVRRAGLEVPSSFRGIVPKIVCSSNPGNVGHLWVKRTFIDSAEPYVIWKTPDEEGGMLRQFIPARLSDNPTLIEQDPNYEARLSGLGSPELVRAYRDGDWNIIQGSFFPEFCNLHVIDPFPIPDSWPKVRGMDWGSRDPCSIGWMAVTPEDHALDELAPKELRTGFLNHIYNTDRRIIPKHSRIFYRHWYIADPKDRGIRLSNRELAEGILRREDPEEKVLFGVAGRDIFRNLGGPSIAEQLNRISQVEFRRGPLFSRQADTRRIPGWNEFRSRLIGVDGYPQLYVFRNLRDMIRLIPSAQADDKKPEDMSQVGDHVCEKIRYCLMSFLHPEAQKEESASQLLQDWSLETLWREKEERGGL